MELLCENCGQKVIALKTQAGKTCSCPKCGKSIDVPEREEKFGDRYSEHDITFLNIEEKEEIRRKEAEELKAHEEAEEQAKAPPVIEKSQKRRFPWLIDIFLYPFSKSGLKHLAIFIGVPLIMDILLIISPVQLSILIGFFRWVLNVIIFLYLYWYLAECIRDSAGGWVRAPEGVGGFPDFGDMIMQTANIIGCLVFFLLPAVVYIIYVAKRIDYFAWLFIIPGIFFYPMGLLSVILYDSVGGLSRHVLTSSIRKTIHPYIGLSLLYFAILFIVLVYKASELEFPWKTIFRFCVIYYAFILAHLTGRFYWKYKEELNWKI